MYWRRSDIKMKQTEIGLIPDDWEVVELRSTGEVIYGIQAAVANNTTPNGTIILTNINITIDGEIDLEKVRYYKLKSKRDFNTILRTGDILFNWRSGSKEHVGKTAIFNLEGEYTHSSFILRIRPNEKVDNYYLYLYLNYLRATGYFVKQQTYSINAKFNKSAIEVLPTALPPKTEQQTISHILTLIQSAIQKQEQIIRTTTDLKNALMQKLFTEGTKGEAQKQTEIGLIPESWEVVELGEVCDLIKNTYEPQANGNKPYVGLEHIIPGIPKIYAHGYENEVVSSKNQFKTGQMIYGKLRPYLDKAAIPDFDGICSTDILVFNGKNKVENIFLINLLHTEKFIAYAKATTTGVQHPRTSWSSLKKFKFALADHDERVEIAKILDTVYKKIQHHQTKKQTLTALFRSMLHQLMTGQIRVKDLEFSIMPETGTAQ